MKQSRPPYYRLIAVCAAALAFVRFSARAAPPSDDPPGPLAVIAAAIGSDPVPDPAASAVVNTFLQQSGTNEGIARLVENPAFEVSAEASGGYISPAWLVDPSLQVGRESDRATTGFTLSRTLGKLGVTTLQVKFDPDDKKPTLAAVFNVGPKLKVDGEDRTMQAVYSIKFQYRNKYDYLNALGVDARTLPGAGTILDLMNRKAVESAAVPASTSAVQAAGQALQQALVPQIFQSASQFEKVTIGTGYQVTLENPLLSGGEGQAKVEVKTKRSMTILHQERLEPGQKPGAGVRFDEVNVSVGMGGEGEVGGNKVSADGSVAVSYSTDPEKQEEGVGEERRKLADSIRAGRFADAGALAAQNLAPWVHAASINSAVTTVRRALADEAPKGVKIHFDDNLLEGLLQSASVADGREGLVHLADALEQTTDAAARAAIVGKYVRQLKAGYLSARPRRTLGALRLVSLHSLVTAAEPYAGHWNDLPAELRTPGGIARVIGFQIDASGHDVLLIGEVIPGAPLLTIDDLIVGIRTVWKNGTTPFCSLDPDPADIAGAQHVRVSGVPGDSGFARVMLDADYLMKRMSAGLAPVEVADFHSYKDLLRADVERGQTSQVANRFWLYPCPLQTGDIEMSPDGGVVLFNTGMQVLSEQMVLAHEGLLGTGTVNATADKAAAELTQALPELEAVHAEFRHLHGLFDVVLLAKTWQRLNTESQWVTRLAALPYTRVDVPLTYAGVKVVVAEGEAIGGTYYLAGGVRMRLSAGSHAWLVTDDRALSALHPTSPNAPGQISRPLDASAIVLPAGSSSRSASTLDAATVLAMLRRGDTAHASTELRKLIEADPYDPEPWCLRAMIDFHRQSYDAAVADAGHALELDPDNPSTVLLAAIVRFQSHQLTGQLDAALKDIDLAIRQLPDSPRAHILKGDALLGLDRAAEARTEYKRAVELDPSSVMGNVSLGLLDVSEGWVVKGKKRIEKARVQAGAEQNLPAIKAALAVAEMGVAVLGDADAHLEAARQDASDVLADPASDPQSRLRALIAMAGLSLVHNNRQAADDYLRQALDVAPTSPEPLLMMAAWAHEQKQDEVARGYVSRAEQIAPGYPAVQQMRRQVGTPP